MVRQLIIATRFGDNDFHTDFSYSMLQLGNSLLDKDQRSITAFTLSQIFPFVLLSNHLLLTNPSSSAKMPVEAGEMLGYFLQEPEDFFVGKTSAQPDWSEFQGTRDCLFKMLVDYDTQVATLF